MGENNKIQCATVRWHTQFSCVEVDGCAHRLAVDALSIYMDSLRFEFLSAYQ